jgi:ribonuclease G
MSKEIVVNVADEQTRIAIVEDGKLAELYIENAENKRTIGNIYLGRIRKVMPSIQAAFVDIGQEQDAFLHFSDVSDNLPYLVQFLDQNGPKVEKVDLPDDGIDNNVNPANQLNRGQPLLVQITKEPISDKGSRISTDLSLAGRFLVLVPLQNYIAVSRKITDQKERRRLKALAGSLVPEGFGVIVRTVAEGRDAKSLDKDLKLLMERWRRIEKALGEDPSPPRLIHEDVDMASSIIRDQFSDEYDRILVDSPSLYHSIRSYVKAVAPKMVDCVALHEGDDPVFEAAGIQRGADRAFKDRVELPSGGYLFIERTEAMHVVDVNSGRSGHGMSQAENSLNVNLEAARVIARQIRLRDLGGIIVVDFIDLRSDKDKKKVYDELKKGFKDDRAVTKVLPMSDFGLVEITRQRLRPSITTTFSSANGAASGDGEGDGDARLQKAEREIQRLEQKVRARDRELEKLKEEGGDETAGEDVERLRQEIERLKKEAAQAREQADKARKRAREEARKAEQQAEARKRAEADAREADGGGGRETADREADRETAGRKEQSPVPRGDGGGAPAEAVVREIEEWIADHRQKRRTVTLQVHPFTAAFLNRPVPSHPTRWFMDHLVRVHVEPDDSLSPLAYRFVDSRSGDELETGSAARPQAAGN